MFEKSLESKLKRIFDMSKVSFDLPSASQEEECIFIEVGEANSTIKDQRQICKVMGRLRVFAPLEKLPYGYFAKRIAQADYNDTKDFFFFNIEKNQGTFVDIAERNMEFVYFYDSQFDPDRGLITSVDLETA